jgi:hypothetical protein
MRKLLTSIDFYILLIIAGLACFYLYNIFFGFKLTSELQSETFFEIKSLDKDSSLQNFSDNIGNNFPDSLRKVYQENQDFKDYTLGKMDAFSGEGIGVGSIGIRNYYPFKYINLLCEKNRIRVLDSTKLIVSQYENSEISKKLYDSLNTSLTNRKLGIDSCFEKGKSDLFYITLENYRLKDFAKFFIQNNKNYIEYVRFDSVQNTNGNTKKIGTKMYEETPILFLTENFNQSPRKTKLCIPITKDQYNTYYTIFHIFFFISVVLTIVITIGMPLVIVLNIAKGLAFVPQNILYLKIISFSCLISGSIDVLFSYIVHFIFRNQIPQSFEIDKNIVNGVFDNLYSFFFAIAIFIVSKAFQKGAKLQEQNDLTI